MINRSNPELDWNVLEEKTFLITGACGMLGTAFQAALTESAPGATVLAKSRKELNVVNEVSVLSLEREKLDYILHCAADVDADRCERQPGLCRQVQLVGTLNVIELARRTGAKVYYPQSVFIFDGTETPITEETTPAPLFAYGKYKLAAEEALLESLPNSLVVRMAGFFGGEARDKNFVGKFSRHIVKLLASGKRECAVGDRLWQPTYTLDLARNCLALLACGRTGIYSMACHGEASFYEVAAVMVDALDLGSKIRLCPRPSSDFSANELASRPQRVYMENRRLAAEGLDFQRHWEVALREYLGLSYFRNLFCGVCDPGRERDAL